MAVEVSGGRNSAPWAPLIFSSAPAQTSFQECLKLRVQLGSGSRRLCSFCAVLSPKGDRGIPRWCHPPGNHPCTQVCGLCLSLSSAGLKERSCKAALSLCVCSHALELPHLASSWAWIKQGWMELRRKCWSVQNLIIFCEFQAINDPRILAIDTDLHGISDTDWISKEVLYHYSFMLIKQIQWRNPGATQGQITHYPQYCIAFVGSKV